MRQLFALLAFAMSLALFYPLANANMTPGYDHTMTLKTSTDTGDPGIVVAAMVSMQCIDDSECNTVHERGSLMAGMPVIALAPDVWLFRTAVSTRDNGGVLPANYVHRHQPHRWRC